MTESRSGNAQGIDPVRAAAHEAVSEKILGCIPGQCHCRKEACNQEEAFHPEAVNEVVNVRQKCALCFEEPGAVENDTQRKEDCPTEIDVA